MESIKNGFGFLIETIDPLPTKTSFGKAKGRVPYMTNKDIISNFGYKQPPKQKTNKKRKVNPRSKLAFNIMHKEKITLKQAWAKSRRIK
jgi:hypothetical protein